MEYSKLSKNKLESIHNDLLARYERYKSMGLSLDMSRGKPGDEQLSLSKGLITCLSEDEYISGNIDCRNYGGIDGIPAMKKIFADLLNISPEQVVVGGNSSLAMMFDSIAVNMTHGPGESEPWFRQGKGEVKFLCPVPGYDRHFSICEYFGIQMIPVPMNSDGPDMDLIERLARLDSMIKGIWCVPLYSNPGGAIYSDETIRRFAALSPAAVDFRIYWDDAYHLHHLYANPAKTLNIIDECEKAGNPNMPYVFASFSKISFSGAAVACVASSVSNVEYIKKRLSYQTIGPDKINQLRHVKFFRDANGVIAQMKEHAKILAPKFELIHKILERELLPLGIAKWSRPLGGYFISFDAPPHTAERIVALCGAVGLTLTPAGAAYPYRKDPLDSNIRIAPSYPTLLELEEALDVFCVCVKIAAIEILFASLV